MIRFGDGEAGRRPPTADEQLEAGYRIGLGDLRNPAAGVKQRVDIALQVGEEQGRFSNT